jgi:hypothetical protein
VAFQAATASSFPSYLPHPSPRTIAVSHGQWLRDKQHVSPAGR